MTCGCCTSNCLSRCLHPLGIRICLPSCVDVCEMSFEDSWCLHVFSSSNCVKLMKMYDQCLSHFYYCQEFVQTCVSVSCDRVYRDHEHELIVCTLAQEQADLKPNTGLLHTLVYLAPNSNLLLYQLNPARKVVSNVSDDEDPSIKAVSSVMSSNSFGKSRLQ